MLRSISIRNLAVVAAADVQFQPGLTVLSGETGVGKSILMDAVDLLLGGRASTDVIRTGESATVLSAVFEQPTGALTLTREIAATGRSRGAINGTAASNSALRELAPSLVEILGQHEHLQLLDAASHLGLLDSYVAPTAERRATALAWSALADAKGRLDRARMDAGERERRLARIAEELKDIDGVAPRPGEHEEALATRGMLVHADRIQRLCLEGYEALYSGETSVLSLLGGIWKRTAELAELDPAFRPYLEARDAIKAQLSDLADSLRAGADRVEDAAAQLERVEARLAALERLTRKYGATIEELLEQADRHREEQRLLTSPAGEEALLAEAWRSARTAYLGAARQLSKARQAAAPTFSQDLERLLHQLAMEHARVEVRFESLEEEEPAWSERGLDRAEFYLSTNLGESPRPLGRVISGGELSRAALALRTLTAAATEGRTLIFDEVDAGLGGRTADVVGQCLRRLAGRFQVIAITHVPQIAAYADHQIRIRKETQRGRTVSFVDHLDAQGRREEIARMLAGAAITPAALEAADQLLAAANQRPGESKHRAKAKA